ncbi:S9 family peptidase [Sphingobacterium psychroaquaticum]|uniref:Dipeptidyl aminopeptidase/acylaminoacyl peptidase n=1 Tax=Sphingobacterium psychroaquaticum TaxID=561061 RepID=A0A1X7KN97_9SPHI|nr:S9 family peptidase [Sphingobacterium psychroaquaticum]SMG42675.1 Dipeptidyl aminopeptidase/acylaminoacyl peptidase [Sphingobacterium psychroaquaticum]
MNKVSVLAVAILLASTTFAQRAPEKKIDKSLITDKMQHLGKDLMTPEKLWEIGRVSAEGLSADGKYVVYGVSQYSFGENKSEKNLFVAPVAGGAAVQFTEGQGGESVVEITNDGQVIYLYKGQLWQKPLQGGTARQLTNMEGGLENVKLSPDKKHILFSRSVLIQKNHSVDKYSDLTKSNVYIYDDLDYRHWDSFNDGRFSHPFVASYENGTIGEPLDILKDKPFYSPQAPFGGADDFAWSPDSKAVLYVCKKKVGKEYAQSTNTDIYRYDLANGTTTNLTEGMNGYDTAPTYSPDGQRLSWLSMKTDGYEADKVDIVVFDKVSSQRLNLTGHWDGTVNSFIWSKDNRRLYFTAPVKGTVQLFEVEVPVNFKNRALPKLRQISEGQFDISGIVGETNGGLVVTSTTMTRATELYLYDLKKNTRTAITTVNDKIYNSLAETKVEGRYTKASDGQDLFSWVIYPPDFDPTKKYPTLLFCQGGPQSATTLGYSFRWNFQLMASQGYIVILPNRRGMPGWGTKWNEDISKDWGGQAIRDYLSAIDDFSKESYVDKSRVGAIGASYGGYSVFMLAGVHENRFKTFISHCGLFDMTSWYGTTEELFFANHDLGGPYWDKANAKTYNEFNPIKHVDKWNTPIMIMQGGKDYRVPIGQGLEAFQAAQLKNIKSRLVYMPDENHWVLSGHNAQVWQREFFGWLKETL